ncbi:MAG: type II toxin-antitoxin system HicA family toxin [Acidobacteriota bacterium]|nr:type II toxin-antitoxin system HicA family toxin [Acidobacteriota bacterium]
MAKQQRYRWRAIKAKAIFAALLRIGWQVKRQKGSHKTLGRPGWPDYVFAYHDRVELGPIALEKLGKKTGLTPKDL